MSKGVVATTVYYNGLLKKVKRIGVLPRELGEEKGAGAITALTGEAPACYGAERARIGRGRANGTIIFKETYL